MHKAAIWNQVKILDLMLKHGGDSNIQDDVSDYILFDCAVPLNKKSCKVNVVRPIYASYNALYRCTYVTWIVLCYPYISTVRNAD